MKKLQRTYWKASETGPHKRRHDQVYVIMLQLEKFTVTLSFVDREEAEECMLNLGERAELREFDWLTGRQITSDVGQS